MEDLYEQKRSDIVRPYIILFKREAVQNITKENNLILNLKTSIIKKNLSLNNNNININNNISNF